MNAHTCQTCGEHDCYGHLDTFVRVAPVTHEQAPTLRVPAPVGRSNYFRRVRTTGRAVWTLASVALQTVLLPGLVFGLASFINLLAK